MWYTSVTVTKSAQDAWIAANPEKAKKASKTSTKGSSSTLGKRDANQVADKGEGSSSGSKKVKA
jgi:hypothetical protein